MQQWTIITMQLFSGIIKIASKMGISTIQSYQGAKIFEAIGLKQYFIDKYFTDTVSRVGGIGIEEIAEDYMQHSIQKHLIRLDCRWI